MKGSLEAKNVFVVLGMARSGTSAISRSLQALGIDLGTNLTPGGSKWNAKGFFEDTEIVYQINGKLFNALNFAPYGIERLERAKQLSAAAKTIKTEAKKVLTNRFATTDYWGFKDPSTVKVLAFWQAIFSEMQINDQYIIALRNPLASALSYQKLTGTSIEVGLMLWTMHLLSALDDTQGKKRIVVSYEHLLQNPREQLQRIKQAFQLPDLVDEQEVEAFVSEFLDPAMRHYDFSLDDLRAHSALKVMPLCVAAYELLLKLSQDEITFTEEAFVKDWAGIKQELEIVYPVYCYIDALLKKTTLLERNLRRIKKSYLWKMLYPLRLIDDALRRLREKRRSSRRLSKAYG